MFSEMSAFHDQFGFYLDGVDEHTARLPLDWMERAVTAEIDVYGRPAMILCPTIEDVAVSKLFRFAPKDVDFIRECVAAGRLDIGLALTRFPEMQPDLVAQATARGFLLGMARPKT